MTTKLAAMSPEEQQAKLQMLSAVPVTPNNVVTILQILIKAGEYGPTIAKLLQTLVPADQKGGFALLVNPVVIEALNALPTVEPILEQIESALEAMAAPAS
jgi:hypothetical protein